MQQQQQQQQQQRVPAQRVAVAEQVPARQEEVAAADEEEVVVVAEEPPPMMMMKPALTAAWTARSVTRVAAEVEVKPTEQKEVPEELKDERGRHIPPLTSVGRQQQGSRSGQPWV
jgi:hypothetical protein